MEKSVYTFPRQTSAIVWHTGQEWGLRSLITWIEALVLPPLTVYLFMLMATYRFIASESCTKLLTAHIKLCVRMSKRHISVGQQMWALLYKNFLKKRRMKRETLVWFSLCLVIFGREKNIFSGSANLYLHYLMFSIYSVLTGRLGFF